MKSHSRNNASASYQIEISRKASIPIRKYSRSRFRNSFFHSPYRIDRVARPRLHVRLCIRRFQQRRQKPLLSRQRQRHHRVAMKVRRDRRLLLVRRNISGNEPDFFQLESLSGRAGHIHVSAMDGIEGSAEQSDVHSVRSYSLAICGHVILSESGEVFSRPQSRDPFV